MKRRGTPLFLVVLLPAFSSPHFVLQQHGPILRLRELNCHIKFVYARLQRPLRLIGGSPDQTDVPDNAPASCPGTSSAEAGKIDSCQGCPNQSACASGAGIGPDQDKLDAKLRMEKVNYKLLVLSGKGGVGKSTLAAQLAMALSANGDLTGLLDIDICGPSIPRMVAVEGEEVRQA
jgi:hypothetical protein